MMQQTLSERTRVFFRSRTIICPATPAPIIITRFALSLPSLFSVIELNQADTLTLKKIPGIGSTFARRIVGYRELLGGFYTVEQLAEVYGIDEERYNALHTWFKVDTTCIQPLRVNQLSFKELLRHPYLNTSQVRQIERLRRKAPLQSWNDLILLEEFSAIDRQRLRPYLSYE